MTNTTDDASAKRAKTKSVPAARRKPSARKRGNRRASGTSTPAMDPEDIYLTGEAERAIYNRLSRLEGQVRGVKKMLAERKSCDEMLVQISALKQAVNGVAAELLQAHMHTCVLGRIEIGDGERALASLRSALAKVMKHG